MHVTITNIIRQPAQTELVRQFFTMRQRVFVSKLSWKLNVYEGMEFEQYDQFSLAHYVLAHHEGRLVGGARLLRCDAVIGTGNLKYSYMIRDAWQGKIGLPAQLCDVEPPADDASWELTRFTVDADHPDAGRAILEAANEFLLDQGARQCLFLGSPAFMRMARRYGYEPSPLGPICGNKDGRFIAFACHCVDRRHASAGSEKKSLA